MKRLQLLLAAGLLLTAVPVWGQEETSSSPLLELLSYVPDTMENREWLTYGNQAAWYESWEIEPMADLDDLLARNEASDRRDAVAWLFVMPRQATPVEVLGGQYIMQGGMAEYYGFDQFDAEQYLTAGQPPSMTNIVKLDIDPDAVASTLAEHGYSAEVDETRMLFSINEDNAIDMRSDAPRPGMLGQLNRIALLEDGIALIGRGTPVVENALEAHTEGRSLADDSAYQTAAALLEGEKMTPYGPLVGTMLIDSSVLMLSDIQMTLGERITPEQLEDLMAAQEEYFETYPLPAYRLAAFSTHHTPGTSYYSIALVLNSGADAQAAADVLRERLEGYTMLSRDQTVAAFFEERRIQVETAVGVTDGELPVALVVLSMPDPPLTPDSGGGQARSYVFTWMDWIARRDTGFLAVQ